MPDEKKVTTKFVVDISDLKSKITEANRQMKLANAQFKASSASLDDWSTSADGLSAKIEQMTKITESQTTKVEAYRGQLAKVRQAYDENSRRAEELRKQLDQLAKKGVDPLSDEYKEHEKALDEVVKAQEANKKAAEDLEITVLNQEAALNRSRKELSGYQKALDSLDGSVDEVAESSQKATEGFTVMRGALANLVAEGIKKAISGLKDLSKAAIDSYKDYDEGADAVITATGATGEAAEKLQKSYKTVAKSVVGDMGSIGEALGEVNTRFGFTDEQLEDATQKFIKFAKITGTDAKTAVQLVSRAMGDAGIDAKDYESVLDDLAIASQASGISIDDLTKNLAKYGAPMRALGLDTKESIAIFAGWEKAGVNTETAFSGMRQAIGRWGKDGKDARLEFKKTLDEIEKCPDIATATTKAIEIFGQEAGPDLADAIKGGRFEYSNFLKLLDSSKGTVTKTYEATQNGFDKVKLAIQGGRAELGEYVSELAEEYEPEIEAFAKTAVSGLKSVLKFVAENIRGISTFAAAAGGAFAVKKVVDFAKSIGTTVGVIKKVVTAVKGAEAATKLLNIAQAATPWGLATAAVGGMAAAFVALRKKQEAAIAAEYGLTEAQKETVKAAEESAKAYAEMDAARDEELSAVTEEYGYLTELKEEYNGLIDANGKVKKGYEDRANFILENLSSALGIERDEILKNVDANGKLGKSIDEIIIKKQGEAALAAAESAYTTAITERNAALKTYMDSQATYSEAETKYKKLVKESGDVLGYYNGLLKGSPASAEKFYWANQTAIKGQQEAKKAMEEAKTALDDAEGAYVGYTTTIENYEGLSSSIISGDAKKISKSLEYLQADFVTAETGTKATLEKQLANLKTNYAAMEKAVKDGTPGVTKAQLAAAKSMVDAAEGELNKLSEKAAAAGSSGGKNYALAIASEENQKASEGAGLTLATSAKGGAESVDSSASGGYFASGFVNGIKSFMNEAFAQAEALARNAHAGLKKGQQEGSPSKLTMKSGEFFGSGYVNGIRKQIKAAAAAAGDLASAAVDALDRGASSGRFAGISGFSLRGGLSAAAGNFGGATVFPPSSGSRSSTTTNNVTYHQVINAPKALSRIEIYRQTRNLLSLKEI